MRYARYRRNSDRKRKITEVGQACRHCETPVIEKTHKHPPREEDSTGGYYFKRWLKCPRCKALYMLESEKVWFPGREPRFADTFAEMLEQEDAML